MATLTICVSLLNRFTILIGTIPNEPETESFTKPCLIPLSVFTAVNALTTSANCNSNSTSGVSNVVVNVESLSFINLPLP